MHRRFMILASLALLPPMLSTIFDYPTVTTGLVMAPRGVGTMISMLLVGRVVRFIDPRILVIVGLALTAQSLYTMSGFSPAMGMLNATRCFSASVTVRFASAAAMPMPSAATESV